MISPRHTTEMHILVNLRLQCTRNGQRTIQLPEQGPVPAGPETRFEYRTKGVALGEHSTIRCSFFFFLFFYIDHLSADTGIFFLCHITSLTSFGKLWLSLIGTQMTVCCNELPTSQLDSSKSTGNEGCKDLTTLRKINHKGR